MKLLKPLLSLLRKPKLTDLSHGVTRTELAALRTLATSAEWPTYLSVLERVQQSRAEEMLLTDDVNLLVAARGRVQGIREAATLIDKLVLEDEGNARRQRERSDRELERSKRGNDSFYGTPYWRTTDRS